MSATLCLVLAAVGCTATTSSPSRTSEGETRSEGRMKLIVTVDWEGRALLEPNLHAMEELRARFPQVKLVQFLNAAYFTKPNADGDEVAKQIRRTLLPDDELGLHIHGWKRLVEASSVTFRSSPTFWGRSIDPEGPDCAFDCGHDVPIDLYTAEELRQVVAFSHEMLDSHGLGRATSFRCGGWIAGPAVREAIAREGIRWDHSEVPTPFLREEIGYAPLYASLTELWPDTRPTSQPHALELTEGSLGEIPDNGAMADYVSADEMFTVWEANKEVFLADRTKNVVVSIGFHQETAAKFLPRIEEALTRIFEDAKAERLPLDSVTSDALSAE